jgi:hypothetical protein
MLNLSCFDKEDVHILEASYNAIRQKGNLEIIQDETTKQLFRDKFVRILNVSADASLSIQNLFKIQNSTCSAYISQCLIDFGYPVSPKLVQLHDRVYHYQIMGYAISKVDLGNTILRPESKADRLISRFVNSDIDFEASLHFSEKYYLTSSSRLTIEKHFNKGFVDTIAKYDNVHLLTKGNEIFIMFDTEVQPHHSRAIEEILFSYKALATF